MKLYVRYWKVFQHGFNSNFPIDKTDMIIPIKVVINSRIQNLE